jgi:hypothetical protein
MLADPVDTGRSRPIATCTKLGKWFKKVNGFKVMLKFKKRKLMLM